MTTEQSSELSAILDALGKALDRVGELYRDYLAKLEAARTQVHEQATGDLDAVDGKTPAPHVNHAPSAARKEES